MLEEVETPHPNMGLVKLIFMNFCLATIAISSCFNGIIAFSIAVTLAAVIIKIYKLDPEPFFLLSLHTVVTCLMLHDTPTTMAVMAAVIMTCLAAGSMEVSSERIAVFLVSMAMACLMGSSVASVVAAIGLLVAIIAIRLRPLRPATHSVLGLLLLGASVPANGHMTAILSAIMAVMVIAWYLLQRFQTRTELLYLEHMGGNHNNVNNNNNNNNNIADNHGSRIALMNGGHLNFISTTDSLDLHGHTVTSALKSLHQFLKEHEDSYRENRTGHTRYLKVITGEDGKNHPEDSLNLVKPTVANFLKINKYRFQAHPDRPGILKIDLESHVK